MSLTRVRSGCCQTINKRPAPADTNVHRVLRFDCRPHQRLPGCTAVQEVAKKEVKVGGQWELHRIFVGDEDIEKRAQRSERRKQSAA